MQIYERPTLGRVLGKAGRAVGRFARDVAYMELVPKDVEYKPSYLNNVTLVSPLRIVPKLAAAYLIAHKGLSQGELPVDPQYAIPAIYLAADMVSNWALATWNLFRRTRESYGSDWCRDNLGDQPATLAVEVPYRAIRVAGKAAKAAGKGVAKSVRHLRGR